jgi:AraC family transcriptional regulator
MLHCRLPERVALQTDPAMLGGCIDMRNSVVASCLRRIAQETLTPGFGSQAIVEGLGLVIAGELERAMGTKSSPLRKGGLAPWQLRRIDDHLRAGYWDSGVSDVARLCGVSAGHAMRAFRQSTGQSIAAHMAAMRIERACTGTALRQRVRLRGRLSSNARHEPKCVSPASAFRRGDPA